MTSTLQSSASPQSSEAQMYGPGAETLSPREIRVSVLGSGDPWIRRSQASGSLPIEVGNPEKDFFLFDLGSASLANFTSLMLAVEVTTKVFLSHLHADHIGDIPDLIRVLEALETLCGWARHPLHQVDEPGRITFPLGMVAGHAAPRGRGGHRPGRRVPRAQRRLHRTWQLADPR